MSDKPYIGSLDPFQDIAEALDNMNVMYILSIGMYGSEKTTTWTNISKYVDEGEEKECRDFLLKHYNTVISDSLGIEQNESK